MKKTVSICIEEQVLDVIKKQAEKEHRSLSNMFEYLVAYYIKHETTKHS